MDDIFAELDISVFRPPSPNDGALSNRIIGCRAFLGIADAKR
jgi:hypothetical protein